MHGKYLGHRQQAAPGDHRAGDRTGHTGGQEMKKDVKKINEINEKIEELLKTYNLGLYNIIEKYGIDHAQFDAICKKIDEDANRV